MHVLTSNITHITLTDASIVLMQICDARPHLKYYISHLQTQAICRCRSVMRALTSASNLLYFVEVGRVCDAAEAAPLLLRAPRPARFVSLAATAISDSTAS